MRMYRVHGVWRSKGLHVSVVSTLSIPPKDIADNARRRIQKAKGKIMTGLGYFLAACGIIILTGVVLALCEWRQIRKGQRDRMIHKLKDGGTIHE